MYLFSSITLNSTDLKSSSRIYNKRYLHRSRSKSWSRTDSDSRSSSSRAGNCAASSNSVPKVTTKSKIKPIPSEQDQAGESIGFKESSELSLLLASPFLSRASSPVSPVLALDASFRGKSKMGPPIPSGLNLIKELPQDPTENSENSRTRTKSLQSDQSGSSRLSPSLNASSSLPKSTGRKHTIPMSTNGSCKSVKKVNVPFMSWKDRRPSAPASLQRPPKPYGRVYVPSKAVKMTGYANVTKDTGKSSLHFAPDIHFRLPSTIVVASLKKDKTDFDLLHNHDPYSWMNARSEINFNRPPSQLSITMIPLFDDAKDEAQCPFLSSGEEEGEEEGEAQRRACVEKRFGKDAPATSTPFKNGLARTRSSHVIGKTNGGREHNKAKSKLMKPDIKNEASVIITCEERSGVKDMELTAPLECEADAEEKHNSFQDRTTWITDSIISPPTMYLNHQEKDAETLVEENCSAASENAENIDLDNNTHLEGQNLSSPFKFSLSESTGTSVDESSSDLDDLLARGQEGSSDDRQRTVKEKIGECESPILSSRKTQFGTGPHRRTRTGTIVGPSTANPSRTRSGTIIAKDRELNAIVSGARRTRSGTIIGPLPDLAASSKCSLRCRSGTTMYSQIPDRREEEVTDEGDAAALAVDNIEKDVFGNRFEEADEADGFADSLFVPFLASSPDPIDFLSAANVMEREDESSLNSVLNAVEGGIEYVKEMLWCVSDEPPSPDVRRGRAKSKGKGKGRFLTRFLGVNGLVEELDPEDRDMVDGDICSLGENLSDDELLLVEGQSTTLFI